MLEIRLSSMTAKCSPVPEPTELSAHLVGKGMTQQHITSITVLCTLGFENAYLLNLLTQDILHQST